jgi:hypothetical protein
VETEKYQRIDFEILAHQVGSVKWKNIVSSNMNLFPNTIFNYKLIQDNEIFSSVRSVA